MLELRTGTEIEGRYVIHCHIGTGGYASVWKASDKQLGRDVAIKWLLKKSFASDDDTAAAIREAQKNAQLIHPNIVQVYDILSIGDPPENLIIMEYVDGPSLHELLRTKVRKAEVFALDQAVSLLKEILGGVAFAHSKSICHRDLTPMNILIAGSGSPKIADFGIARVLHGTKSPAAEVSSTHGGTGNPFFMSPEQARGEPADFLSDLFMVGIVGYLLLSGRHPFADASGLFTIPELIADPDFTPETPKPSAQLPAAQQRLYREYAAVITRLLHRERAARFASAQEAINAIEAVSPFLECPGCGERVPEHHKFCGFCGKPLAVSEKTSVDLARQLPQETTEELVDRGFQLTRHQRWEEAAAAYRRALELDARYQRAYWSLGFALNHLGRFEEALETLARGLALGGGSREHQSQFQYAMAFANANLKRYDDALRQVQEALALQPGSPRTLFLRARIHAELGKVDDAVADATEVLQRSPEHAGALRLIEDLRKRQH